MFRSLPKLKQLISCEFTNGKSDSAILENQMSLARFSSVTAPRRSQQISARGPVTGRAAQELCMVCDESLSLILEPKLFGQFRGRKLKAQRGTRDV